MKNNPALPGGLLKSKPTWLNTFEVCRHVGFFRFPNRKGCNRCEVS